jgi:hypothetical protein
MLLPVAAISGVSTAGCLRDTRYGMVSPDGWQNGIYEGSVSAGEAVELMLLSNEAIAMIWMLTALIFVRRRRRHHRPESLIQVWVHMLCVAHAVNTPRRRRSRTVVSDSHVQATSELALPGLGPPPSLLCTES